MLEVATTTTPRANSASNSRPRIMASAMSCTWNSSKHSSAASATMASASGGIGSASPGWACFQRWMRWWQSCMNWWKWIRCFRGTSAQAKNRSISMDFPRPTSPTR